MPAVDIRRTEWASLFWASAWFFCVLAGYYAIRPVRETYAVDQGSLRVSYLFGLVLAAMLCATPIYGWVVGQVPRGWLPTVVYGFFSINLLAFHLAFALVDSERLAGVKWAFYVWVSVFNLFTVTLFWSAAVELFSEEQAKRLFGPIAGAGTLGGVVGSLLAQKISALPGIAIESLLWVPSILLLVAIGCAAKLRNRAQVGRAALDARRPDASTQESWRGSMLGVVETLRSRYLLGIALSTVLVSVCATFVYMMQLSAVSAETDDLAERVHWFARQNAWQNGLTLAGQAAVAAWMMRRVGVGWTLASLPLALAAGFAAVARHPTLAVIGLFDIAQRLLGFVIGVPAREVLFTNAPQSAKYRAKAFIDTVGKRGGDALSAFAYACAVGVDWRISHMALAMIPVAGILVVLNLSLGREHDARRQGVASFPDVGSRPPGAAQQLTGCCASSTLDEKI